MGDGKVAAGDGSGHQECAGFDAVGDDGVFRAVKPLHALNPDGGGAGAFDLRAHGEQQFGEVHDFGFARGIAENGFAACQRGGHHQVLGSGDGNPVEVDGAAAKTLGGDRLDVPVRLLDAGAKLFQAENVEVDGPGADGAAAGHGHTGPPAARHQRAQHQAGGTHGLHQLVGSLRADDVPGFQPHRSTLDVGAGADIHQQALHGADIAHARDPVQGYGLFGQQRGRQRGQRGILRTAGFDTAVEGGAALNDELIH